MLLAAAAERQQQDGRISEGDGDEDVDDEVRAALLLLL